MGLSTDKFQLEDILGKAYGEAPLTCGEIKYLLGLTNPKDIERVFELARDLRSRYFSNKVFLYGFVYFSTYCRNNCTFCLYRCSNVASPRYRKTEAEILETAYRLVESGVHLLDLTMGEDPEYFAEGYTKLFRMVEKVRNHTDVPLMISPGVIPEFALEELKEIGVSWYACYQETHNRDLYARLRVGQNYDTRIGKKASARQMGLLIEEGLLTGVGDTHDDIVDSLNVMKELAVDQVRVMSFVPQHGTPMKEWSTVARMRELLIIAVMRLVFPDRLIPASLDVDGLTGLAKRLEAGANVITSIIPPRAGLAGVSQSSLDIEEGNRSVMSLLPVLYNAGMVQATAGEYSSWVLERQKHPN